MDKEKKIACPNGHWVRVLELRKLQESEKEPDLGKVQCPICESGFCVCPKHGKYHCPPPCPWC